MPTYHLAVAHTFNGRFQADFLFRLVQKHHKLGRGEKLALPHAREIRADAPKALGRRRDHGAENGLDQVLGLGLPIEDRHNAWKMP